MKALRVILLTLLMVAGVAGLVAWVSGTFETRYAGVSATSYLLGLLQQSSFGGKEDRGKVLLVPAAVAVPVLTRWTEAQDSRWRGWYQRLYPRLPRVVAQRLGPPKSSETGVLRAVMSLGYYGPEAREAVPQLLKLNATTTSQLLHQALLTTLGDMGPAASNAIPALTLHVQSGSAFVAGMAATALSKVDPRGDRSGAVLVSVLQTPILQLKALDALTVMATNDARWIAHIWQATKHSPRPEMIVQGAYRLQSLHALDATRVQVLMARSSSDDPTIRRGVAEALSYAPDQAGMTTPVLLRLSGDSNGLVRVGALRSLLRYALTTNMDLALRLVALRATLVIGDDSEKWTSLGIVRSLGENAAPLAQQVIALLSEKNERVRAKATEAVPALGSIAKEAEPVLRTLLNDRWAFVREGASAALKEINLHP